MQRLFDTHCHLDDPRFLEGRGVEGLRALLSDAACAGVGALLIPGVDPEEWRRQEALLHALMHGPVQLFSSFGLHPQCLPEQSDESLADMLPSLMALGPAASAIGECGLDGPTARLPGGALERQLEVLEQHLRVAEVCTKPLILHCFKTHDSLLKHLERRGGVTVPLILHSYSGSAELVPRYLRLGAWFSFAGAITWPGARRPLAALRAVPLERLLLETDGPDQCPRPVDVESPPSGHPILNLPRYIVVTLNKMAEVLAVSAEDLARITFENALGLLCPSGSLNNGRIYSHP